MPSRIGEAGHTKAFDFPVAEHWGKAEMFSSAGGTRTDNTSVQSRTRYQLSHPSSPGGSHNPGSSTGAGDLLPTGGIVMCSKQQPRHEKAIPMGPWVNYFSKIIVIPPRNSGGLAVYGVGLLVEL